MRKYRNTPTTIDGIKFHSKGEGLRYLLLKDRINKQEIQELRRQVMFHLHGKNGGKVGRYTVDFLYTENGRLVAEDYKGYMVRDTPMRMKLFVDNYPDIELRVVK